MNFRTFCANGKDTDTLPNTMYFRLKVALLFINIGLQFNGILVIFSLRFLYEKLRMIVCSTVIAKLTYCTPLWSSACSAADCAKLESFVSRCKRLEYCSSEVPTYSDLTDEADDILFSRIMANQGHVYSLFCPTVIPSLTVWENDRIIRHYWTKAHILITMTS